MGSRKWEIDWYQNEWPWTLFRGRLKSCQPLRHIRHWISRKLLDIEACFQWTTNRKWPVGIKWSLDGWRHVTPKVQTRDPYTLRAQYLQKSWRCHLIANYQIDCCSHICELRCCVRPYTFDSKTASTIALSVVHSKLDYCNSLYCNLPNRLQQIQNTVVKAPKSSHITPILRFLHWLNINERI